MVVHTHAASRPPSTGVIRGPRRSRRAGTLTGQDGNGEGGVAHMVSTKADVQIEVNQVELTGRVSGDPTSRDLPSGDELVTLRLVVARDGAGPVDTIDCACWTAASRRAAGRVHDGDRVRVEGALRRRFFRTPGGPASRYEVEVRRLVRDRR